MSTSPVLKLTVTSIMVSERKELDSSRSSLRSMPSTSILTLFFMNERSAMLSSSASLMGVGVGSGVGSALSATAGVAAASVGAGVSCAGVGVTSTGAGVPLR